MVKCRAVNCTTRARYGKVHRKPMFCKPHCSDGDWIVTNKACESDGCFKKPRFGIVWGKPLSCGAHKQNDYVDVVEKRCESAGCTKHRNYGIVWGKGLSCFSHKKNGYVNVHNKRCESDGCTKTPKFGIVRGKPLSCGAHKQNDYVDVYSKTCDFDGCPKIPSFGLVKGKPLACGAHKLDGYIDVINKRCDFDECAKRAKFGTVWCKPLSCGAHKLDGYVDVMNMRCKSSVCIVLPMLERGMGRYKVKDVLLCGDCMRQQHPDLVKRFQVRAEQFILAELQRRMPELEDNFLSWDCPLPCAISTERADMLWQIGSTLLHVEVDETATHEDDRNRLMRLLAGTDCIEHIVVRIHTHSYDNYKPCVTKSQINGEYVVACRQKEFDRRMAIVVPEIRKLLAEGKSVVKVMFLS